MQGYYRIIILLGFLLLITYPVITQPSAPTLTAGLSTVTGQKGTLDIDLISQLISERQEEVKREVLQRKILSKMSDRSFALKNYVYSSFYALLSFKNSNAIEKELLRQVAILSLQVGLAEAILHISFRKARPSHGLEIALINFIEKNYSADSIKAHEYFGKLISKLESERFMLLFTIDRHLDAIAKTDGIEPIKRRPRFGTIMLDAVYEANRNNRKLQTLGFFATHPNLEDSYEELNTYLPDQSGDYRTLYNLVNGAMGVLVDYHPLFYNFINDGDLTIQKLSESQNEASELTDSDFKNKINTVSEYLTLVSSGLGILLENRSITFDESEKYAQEINDIREGLSDFQTRNANALDLNISDYYFLTQFIDPFISDMISLGILNATQVANINSIRQYIFHDLLKKLIEEINSPESYIDALDLIEIKEYGYLIRIITSLSRLDDVKSYEHIFNTLSQVGINSLENTELKFLKDIIYYLYAYATIDRDQNTINIEVEALLSKILSLYENRASSEFLLYFGAGLGQTLDIDYRDGAQALMLDDSSALSSLAFASEKIGFKIKLINNEKIQAKHHRELTWFFPRLIHNRRGRRNQEPIVSDFYFFSYGSGLLYNIANLTTAGKNFDSAMVGMGFGIAFFNSLDLSIWRASPMVSAEKFGNAWSNRKFYGVSFDIKLSEYLSAIGDKKRKAKFAIERENLSLD